MLSAYTLMDRLLGIFAPVHAKWVEWSPSKLHLWEHTADRSDISILEEDMMMIGRYFADADALGSRAEYALLAECIAHLRSHAASVTSGKLVEAEIDKIRAQLEQSSASTGLASSFAEDGSFYAPLSWRIAQQTTAAGKTSLGTIDGLREVYLDIAHLFMLRDGNITPNEEERFKGYHAAFGGQTD